jgi:hypothetical protein
VTTAGACPKCGTAVDPGRARAAGAAPPADRAADAAAAVDAIPEGAVDADSYVPELDPIPWHLKLLAGAVALYLGWRAFQGIEWVVHQF